MSSREAPRSEGAPAEPVEPGVEPSGGGVEPDGGGAVPLPARSMGVWKRRSGAKREHSAGGVVTRTIDGDAHVLLIRDPYRNWGLPKGHVEDGEDPGEAALREVREETGLVELELGPPLGTIDWYFRLDGRLVHKFCEFFQMTSKRGTVTPETEEGITECRWVPAAEAAEQVTYDNAREVVREAVRRLGGEDPGR